MYDLMYIYIYICDVLYVMFNLNMYCVVAGKNKI